MLSSKTPSSPKMIVGRRARSQSGTTVKTSASGTTDESVLSKATTKKKAVVIEKIHRLSLGSSSSGEHSTAGGLGAIIHKVPKRMGWVKAAILMVAETMSLGIMSLPKAMNTLGLIIGPLLIIFFGLLSFLCGLLLWKVKLRHPSIVSFADVMTRMFGKPGKYTSTLNTGIMLLFVMAGHLITFTEMVHVWAGDKTPCLVLLKAVGMIVMAVASLPKLLRSSMWAYYFAAGSIIIAAFILMIDGGVTHPDLGSKVAFIIVPLRLVSFYSVASTISNVMVSYAGHMAYFQVMEEMENVQDFGKSVSLASGIITIQYTLIAVIVYYFYGQDVASPALSSANPVVRKIAWFISIPTIFVAGIIAAFIFNNDLLLLIWKKEQMQPEGRTDVSLLNQVDEEKALEVSPTVEGPVSTGDALPKISSRKEWTARVFIDICTWVSAFVLANAIPGFSNLLALLGALVGWTIVIGQPPLMWLWSEWKPIKAEGTGKALWKESIRHSFFQCRKSRLWFYFCACMLALWPVAAIAGFVGSVQLIKTASSGEKVFSCKTYVP